MNKQTNSAVSMLVRAYRCILHNAHTSSLYGSKKSHCKCLAASMLALLGALSLSYSSAASAYTATETITNDKLSSINSGAGMEVMVNSGSAFDLTGDINFSFTADADGTTEAGVTPGNITISSSGSSDDAYGIRIHGAEGNKGDGSGSFTLTADQDIKIESNNHALSLENQVDVNLSASGSLTIGSASLTDDNGSKNGDAINVSSDGNGTITLSGNTVKLSAGSDTMSGTMGDGIYVDTGAYSKINTTRTDTSQEEEKPVISITSTDGITIKVGNNGIDHRGNGTIELITYSGANTITTDVSIFNKNAGDGIRLEGAGSVILSAQSNTIDAGDAGLNNSSTTADASINVTATSGSNVIIGMQEAVLLNGSGSISVNAGTPPQEGNISLLTDVGDGDSTYNQFNNVFIGAYYGIHAASDSSGTLTAYAQNNNYIGGQDTGIFLESSATGATVDIKAANDNIIGFDEFPVDGATYNGQISNKGIAVNSGKVTLTAGNNNQITVGSSSNQGTAISVTSGGSVTITAGNQNIISGSYEGINISGQIEITATNDNKITGENDTGIHIGQSSGQVILESLQGSNTISGKTEAVLVNSSKENQIIAAANNWITGEGSGINSVSGSLLVISNSGSNIISGGMHGISANTPSDITINAAQENKIWGGTYGILAQTEGSLVSLSSSGNNSVSSSATGIFAYINSSIILNAKDNNIVSGSSGYGICSQYSATVSLTASQNEIYGASGTGIGAFNQSTITLIANNNNNYIEASSYGIYAQSGSSASLSASGNNIINSSGYGIHTTNSNITLEAVNNEVTAKGTGWGVRISGQSIKTVASLTATHQNKVSAPIYALVNEGTSTLSLTATADSGTNIVQTGDNDESLGKGYAVWTASAGQVTLTAPGANGTNRTLGAVYAAGQGTSVKFDATNNGIYSAGIIDDAGDLNDAASTKEISLTASNGAKKQVISALYAEDDAEINISGSNNIILTNASSYKNDASNEYLERTVWAYDKGVINIDGFTYIEADYHEIETASARTNGEPNASSSAIAIAAGTAVNLDKDKVSAGISMIESERAQVNLTYANSSSGSKSFIKGDVLSAYAGVLNIDAANSGSGIDINGNLLAGNGGVMNVDLGTGGTLEGRIDDYGEAGVSKATDEDSGEFNASEEQTFRNPAFSSEIYLGGAVNLSMGAGAKWVVTGQSWVTEINTAEYFDSRDDLAQYTNNGTFNADGTLNSIPQIDLTQVDTNLLDRNESGHALTVYSFNGDAQFKMHLDGDRTLSDMLYIKKANGDYVIMLNDAVSQEDISSGEFDNLRFATVGAGSTASFTVYTQDQGLLDTVYAVGSASYDSASEAYDNEAYNNASASSGKPGQDTVDNFFDTNGDVPEVGEDNAEQASNKIMLLAANSDNSDSVDSATNTTNFFLTGIESQNTSDVGETVLNMSRANYFNAVYLDTFNKRQGEARYTNPLMEDGVWVRMRHDNIGQKSQFDSKNTMFELGYDHRLDYDSGNWHVGAALDYMHGKVEYDMVAGDGDLDRYGAWLYGTWLGKDGQYLDLILKYGHLENDFEVSTINGSVTGDYDNDVFSASAEYGIKFCDEESKLFIEPQLQLQYSYVTDADYITSQGSRIDVDAIESLIGRVGLRLGRDFSLNEMPISMYIRGDIMHEFMGDQDIYAYDNTGVLSVSYDNDETWYDLGFGISVQANERTYIFMEAERVFGANYADTYVFSAGFRHSY